MNYPGQTLNGGPGYAGSQTRRELQQVYQRSLAQPAILAILLMLAISFYLPLQRSNGYGATDASTSYCVASASSNLLADPNTAINVKLGTACGDWLKLADSAVLIAYNYSGNYNPYTTAPLTSHILWTKPEAYGGVLGGDFGGTTTYSDYYSTRQYERMYGPIIMNGYLYYTDFREVQINLQPTLA